MVKHNVWVKNKYFNGSFNTFYQVDPFNLPLHSIGYMDVAEYNRFSQLRLLFYLFVSVKTFSLKHLATSDIALPFIYKAAVIQLASCNFGSDMFRVFPCLGNRKGTISL